MEFKGLYACCLHDLFIVDIGTEWNLKHDTPLFPEGDKLVDIGTEWNLKFESQEYNNLNSSVDIGTEWNLKVRIIFSRRRVGGRYRNRVEFKVQKFKCAFFLNYV